MLPSSNKNTDDDEAEAKFSEEANFCVYLIFGEIHGTVHTSDVRPSTQGCIGLGESAIIFAREFEVLIKVILDGRPQPVRKACQHV